MAVCTPETHKGDCSHRQGFPLHQLFSKLHWCNSVGPLHGCLHPINSQVRLQSQARLSSAPTLFKPALVHGVGPLHGFIQHRNSQVRLQSQARLSSASTLFKAVLLQQCWATAWLFASKELIAVTAITSKAFLCTNSFQSCTGATVLGHCMGVCTPETHR